MLNSKCYLCEKESKETVRVCESCLAELLAYRYPEEARKGIQRRAKQSKVKGGK